MIGRTFLINEEFDSNPIATVVESVDDLAEHLKSEPGGISVEEVDEVKTWAGTANVGDACHWSNGNVVCVSGDTYHTAQLRGMKPVRMIAWVQEWEEKCQWGTPEDNWFVIYATEDGVDRHLAQIREDDRKAGVRGVPEEYDVPVCRKPYKTLLMDSGLIDQVKASKTGVRVKRQPPKFEGTK